MFTDTALITTKSENTIKKLVEKHVPANELVSVAIKGANKEYLICTDRQVYIIKQGFMTGHTFGSGVFKITYKNITSVEMDFNLLTGHFEISTGGVQNTRKSYWSTDNNSSAQMAPNVISLVRQNRSDFEKAQSIINDHIYASK